MGPNALSETPTSTSPEVIFYYDLGNVTNTTKLLHEFSSSTSGIVSKTYILQVHFQVQSELQVLQVDGRM